MAIKLEQSVVYPEVWFIKLDRSTIKISEEELEELISETRKIFKEKNEQKRLVK